MSVFRIDHASVLHATYFTIWFTLVKATHSSGTNYLLTHFLGSWSSFRIGAFTLRLSNVLRLRAQLLIAWIWKFLSTSPWVPYFLWRRVRRLLTNFIILYLCDLTWTILHFVVFIPHIVWLLILNIQISYAPYVYHLIVNIGLVFLDCFVTR